MHREAGAVDPDQDQRRLAQHHQQSRVLGRQVRVRTDRSAQKGDMEEVADRFGVGWEAIAHAE
jgi:hypothetical protein